MMPIDDAIERAQRRYERMRDEADANQERARQSIRTWETVVSVAIAGIMVSMGAATAALLEVPWLWSAASCPVWVLLLTFATRSVFESRERYERFQNERDTAKDKVRAELRAERGEA